MKGFGIIIALSVGGIFSTHSVEAQTQKFTGSISYQKLMRTKTTRVVHWTNHDSTKESLTLNIIPIPAYPEIRKQTRIFCKEYV